MFRQRAEKIVYCTGSLICIFLFCNRQDQILDDKTVKILTAQISSRAFHTLNIPAIPIIFSDTSAESSDINGDYNNLRNKIHIYLNSNALFTKPMLTHLIWHEILHYKHQLLSSNKKLLFTIANLDYFDFGINTNHKYLTRDLFRDIDDYIIEKEIFENKYCQKVLQLTRESYLLQKYTGKKIDNIFITNTILDCVKLCQIIDFEQDSNTDKFEKIFSFTPYNEKINKNLRKLSYTNFLENEQPVCSLFHYASPPYQISSDTISILRLNSQDTIHPFWVNKLPKESIIRSYFISKKLKTD